MKFVDLLIYLRNQTVLAESQQDNSNLEHLFVALGIIEDAIEAGDDKSYWQVVDDLYNSIRHIGIAPHKVSIPSEEAIRAVQSE